MLTNFDFMLKTDAKDFGDSAKSFESKNIQDGQMRRRQVLGKTLGQANLHREINSNSLSGKTDFYVLAFEGGARAADDFASPEFFAQENQGAVFESTDGAEKIM